MARHGAILSLGRALADRDGVGDPAVIGGLLRMVARAAHPARAPQMLQQLFLQGPAGLDEQRAIDRLVGHLEALIVRVGALQPSCDLPRGPLQLELLGYDARQRWVLSQFTDLRPLRSLPGGLIRLIGPVGLPAAVTRKLAAHRRGRSTQ